VMAYGYERSVRKDDLRGFLYRLSNFHIAIPLMFVMLFLWLNGESIWGANWETNTALAYIIMFGFVLSFTYRSNLVWLNKVRLKEGVMNFWIGFLMMFAGMIVLSQFILKGSFANATIASAAVYPTIAMTAFFVAPVEETIFRGVLKEALKGWKLYFLPLGIILTSAAFALMHYAVYGGAVMSLWWAFLMGCVFYLGTNFKPSRKMVALGVAGAIGMHLCYNLFILGILSGGIV
jgi:membrane protease YdiL (CAAX protease family)